MEGSAIRKRKRIRASFSWRSPVDLHLERQEESSLLARDKFFLFSRFEGMRGIGVFDIAKCCSETREDVGKTGGDRRHAEGRLAPTRVSVLLRWERHSQEWL
jgi:hypothetical protein